jgi:hypothetical protein
MPESTWSSNSVQVGLWVLWEVEVDNNIYWDDIDTSSKQVSAY